MALKNILLVLSLSFFSFSVFANSESNSISDLVIAGNEAAPLTIEEFADFQCHYCAIGAERIKEVLRNYPGKIKVIFRNLPLPMHEQSRMAAQMFVAVYLQNPKLAYDWQEEVFAHQDRLKNEGELFLNELAQQLGLDVVQLKSEMKSERVLSRIARDQELAQQHGFLGTPSFVIGQQTLKGAYPYEEFKKIIDEELKK